MSAERLDQLRAMQAEEPEDAFLRYAIALELKRLGRMEEAIADLEALLRDKPDHVASYYQLATWLAELGRVTDAVETCNTGSLRALVQGERKARTELIALRDQLLDSEE